MTTPGKGRIFISYRRADSAGYAGRIYDRLVAHFGEDTIFMDVDTIEAGVDFVEVLQNAVQSCDVLVALIGRQWLNIKGETGERRLDNPEDFVRIEIAAALSRDIRVIPVLVDGAPMPRSTELPRNLKPLARRNALQVNHHSFNSDARRLISGLEGALEAAENSKVLKSRNIKKEQKRLTTPAVSKKQAEKPINSKISKPAWVRFGIGVGVLLVIGIVIGLSKLVPSNLFESNPIVTPTPTLGVGRTMISEKDGMVMVYVPAGEFKMGSELGTRGHRRRTS